MASLVGQSVPRLEDRRFLRGLGRYVDDLAPGDALFAAFLRSPHAQARIQSIRADEALALEGVIGLWTGRDWQEAGHDSGPELGTLGNSDGTAPLIRHRPMLAAEVVCHVGDPLAIVVAESQATALEALDLIEVDYLPLEAVTAIDKALEQSAPKVAPGLESNLSIDWECGDAQATDAAFQTAAHVVEIELVNNRIQAAPIEPRAVFADFDPSSRRYSLYSTTQAPHLLRRWIASSTLRIPEHRLRVVAPDVGGAFGQKAYLYSEEPTLLWLAEKLRRPLRWTASRAENFLGDVQARDHVTKARLALNDEGQFLALGVDTIVALGAYLVPFALACPTLYYGPMVTGLYDINNAHVRVRGAYTNTPPITAHRGVGRVEANYVIERLVDAAAAKMGRKPEDLRRQNLLSQDRFPVTTSLELSVQEANPIALLEQLEDQLDLPALRAEQALRQVRGASLLGIGIATTIDLAGGGPFSGDQEMGPRAGSWDSASLQINPDGSVSLACGTHAHGQSHQTTYAQIVAQALGCALDDIEFVQGDTDRTPIGNGTFASRSITLVGNALHQGSKELVGRARKLAAHLLSCKEEELQFEGGIFSHRLSNQAMSLAEVAEQAYRRLDHPDAGPYGLATQVIYELEDYNYPTAATASVVEVDPQSGAVRLLRQITIDDHGVMINPMIVEGQIHGGQAFGLGQAMMEKVIFDPESGQLLSGSFLDYPLPRAADLPKIEVSFQNRDCASNPLGVKGVGESGAIAAPAALVNAVLDALRPLGVKSIDMPLTPERVWRAIQSAQPD